jgi:hypothetical protein
MNTVCEFNEIAWRSQCDLLAEQRSVGVLALA